MNLIKEKIKEIKLKSLQSKIEKQGIDDDILRQILNLDVDVVAKVKLLTTDSYSKLSYLDTINNLNAEELTEITKSDFSEEVKNAILLNNGEISGVIKDKNILTRMLNDKVSNDTLLLYGLLLFDKHDNDSKTAIFQELKTDHGAIGSLINNKTDALRKLVGNDNFKSNLLAAFKSFGIAEYMVNQKKITELLEEVPELILDFYTTSFETYKKILKNDKYVDILISPTALTHKWGIAKNLADSTNTVKENGKVENFCDHVFAFELIDKFKPNYIDFFAKLSLNIFANPLTTLKIDDDTKKILGDTVPTDMMLLTSRFFNHFFKEIEPALKREVILKFASASYEDRKLLLTLLVKKNYISFREETLKVMEKLGLENDFFFNSLSLVFYYPELTKEILKKEELSPQDILMIKYLFTMPVVTNRPLTIADIPKKLKESLVNANSLQQNKLGISPGGHTREKLFNEYEASIMFLKEDGELEIHNAEYIHHSAILASYIKDNYGCQITDINNASVKLAAVGQIVMVVEGDVMNLYIPSKLTNEQLTTFKSYLISLKQSEKVEFYSLVVNKLAETDLNKISGDYSRGYELNHGQSMNLDILCNIIENTFDNTCEVSIKR